LWVEGSEIKTNFFVKKLKSPFRGRRKGPGTKKKVRGGNPELVTQEVDKRKRAGLEGKKRQGHQCKKTKHKIRT